MLEVREPFHEYFNRNKDNDKEEIRIIKKAPLIDLTLDEMNDSILLESGTDSLLESLLTSSVLAFEDEDIFKDNSIFPVTHELLYNYDFGDDWKVTITKEKDCSKLLQKGHISEEELVEAQTTVLTKHKPVCIHKDGAFVFDDVGGLSGFIRFLQLINEGEDKEERSEHMQWALSLGWSRIKTSKKQIL
jgi:hypothetical protein